jgi:hypothetical protein
MKVITNQIRYFTEKKGSARLKKITRSLISAKAKREEFDSR